MSRADPDDRAAQLRAAGEPFVRARVVLAHKPTSAKPGDEAIVRADGTIEGFVGGSCAESTVRVQSLRLLDAPMPLLLRIRPDAAPAAPDGHREADGTLTVHNPCLSGGALEIFSVVAMGVYPFITSSIILQLLQPLIPQLEELAKRLPLPLALAHNLASAVLLAACLDLALPSRR